MFLFTTPSANQAAAPQVPYAAPLRQASQATGVSFDYLAKTAERESRFDPRAKASTSSATGMFQFLDQTWLGLMKQEGPRLGLGREAEAITSDAGRMSVSDPAMRQKILAMREDPAVSAMMAGAFASRNGQMLQQATGRKPTDGDLYVAHFLGPTGARDLIKLADQQPNASAATHFPEAAAANRSIFFEKGGRARTVHEVYGNLTQSFNTQQQVQADPRAVHAAKADQMFRAKGDGRPMHGLFRSDGEPVASAVSSQWSGGKRSLFSDTQATRVAFFPSETGSRKVMSDAAPSATQMVPSVGVIEQIPKPVNIPLPPKRPDRLGQRPETAAATQQQQVEARQPSQSRSRKAVGQPLDILRFMRPEQRS
jgi:Transglycosylase SLT domain